MTWGVISTIQTLPFQKGFDFTKQLSFGGFWTPRRKEIKEAESNGKAKDEE